MTPSATSTRDASLVGILWTLAGRFARFLLVLPGTVVVSYFLVGGFDEHRRMLAGTLVGAFQRPPQAGILVAGTGGRGWLLIKAPHHDATSGQRGPGTVGPESRAGAGLTLSGGEIFRVECHREGDIIIVLFESPGEAVDPAALRRRCALVESGRPQPGVEPQGSRAAVSDGWISLKGGDRDVLVGIHPHGDRRPCAVAGGRLPLSPDGSYDPGRDCWLPDAPWELPGFSSATLSTAGERISALHAALAVFAHYFSCFLVALVVSDLTKGWSLSALLRLFLGMATQFPQWLSDALAPQHPSASPPRRRGQVGKPPRQRPGSHP